MQDLGTTASELKLMVSGFVETYFEYLSHSTIQVNAFRATGKCRRQVKNVTNFVKNVNILEFHDHNWNHHKNCIQIRTNMPSIGLVTPEITCDILAFGEKKHNFAQ